MAYLYRHIRLDTNEPFYIGISKSNSDYKRANSKLQRSDFWKNITSITEYEVEILLESDDYEFIKQKEIEFIKLYGRRDLNLGTLTNLTDGGEGNLGIIVTEEQRKLRSENSKGAKNHFYGKTHTEESKKLIKDASIGRTHSDEQKKKWSAERSGENHPQFGKPLTDERKKNISNSKLGKSLSEDTRLKMSISRTGKVQTKEHIYNSSIKVIDNTTGEIAGTIKEVALLNGWNYGTFSNRISGNLKNNTNYSKYIEK